MGIFIQAQELEQVKSNPTPVQQRLLNLIEKRVRKNTTCDQWVQPDDTQEWYHLCWERMSDAVFQYDMEPEEKLGQWIHNRTIEIVNMPTDGWIGPWYRNRKDPTNPIGALETAHITLAVCEAIDHCPELFSAEEQACIMTALREKGLPLCKKFAERIYERQHVNNWHIVLLNGYTTAAVILHDDQEVRNAIQLSHIAASFFNQDSYGESIQYSNYAALHLSFLFEILIRSNYAQQDELNLASYSRLMEWYASSFLHMKFLDSLGQAVPRTINFGDSAAVFRPTGDVLVQVAVRMQKNLPKHAALAAWLFEQTYREQDNLVDELASFGFFNQFHYHAVLMCPRMCQALSPEKAGVPLTKRFQCGHIISRDRWENSRAVIAVAGGYDPYNVTSHRHADQNSFQLIVGKERMLIDPGHCCYRLNAQKYSASEIAHNTIQIQKENGEYLSQQLVSGNLFRREKPKNQLLYCEVIGDVQIIASDATNLYPSEITRAIRIWVYRLPNMIFVGDVISSQEPVVLSSQFNLNNRDNKLNVHVYNEHRLVCRRGLEAIKLFEAYSEVNQQACPSQLHFGWNYVHDFYHPLPNQAGQGKEGSSLTYFWKSPMAGTEHVRVHTIAADCEDRIKGWHVFQMEDGFIRIESPSHQEYLDFKLTSHGFEVKGDQLEKHIYTL